MTSLLMIVLAASISRETIDSVVHEHTDAIQACYQEGLDRRPKLKGKIVVLFKVEKDGSVSEAHAKTKTLVDEKVETCVLDLFRTMRFPDLTPTCDEDKDDCT